MTPRLMAGILAGALAVGLIAGWLRPIPDPPREDGDTIGDWQLPSREALERTSDTLFQSALALRWEADTGLQSEAEAEAATQWRLRALLLPEQLILASIGDDPAVQRFGQGDILPDGSRLVAVEQDGVVLERGNCRERRSLYPAPDNPGVECAESDPNEEAFTR